MKGKGKSRLKLTDYVKGILSGDRILLSRTITLVESSLNSDQKLAGQIIEKILPETGESIRIGITGAPGVGKSTFIEAMGKYLTAQNKKVAVLAVDPSSQKTKGSILGDKTRMEELAKDPLAFIRPSSANQSLGGVTESTRDSILLCEAAGYEIIIVETVGVGQSETAVRDMTDFFLLLMLPGSGDELQGIKKGIMEMADGIAITKSDGENLKKAKLAQTDFQHALHLFLTPDSGLIPKVILTSSTEKKGIEEVWNTILSFKKKTIHNGFYSKQRSEQNLSWFHSQVSNLIRKKITGNKKMKTEISSAEENIQSFKTSPGMAAKKIVNKIKLLIILLLLCNGAMAQNLAPQARRTPAITDMFNGMPFARPDSKLVGDIYINPHWALTSIETKNSEKPLEWYWTRYDIYSDEMEIKTPAGIKVMKGGAIKQFTIQDSSTIDKKFISAANFKKEGVPLTGFVQVLTDGQRPLLKRYTIIVKRPDYNPALNAGSRDTEITKDIDDYYAVEGELIKIPNTKKFIASLGEHGDKVNAYMKANNLYLKDENDRVKIFEYYNSLF